MNLETLKNKYLDVWDFIDRQCRDNKKADITSLSIILKDNEIVFDIVVK